MTTAQHQHIDNLRRDYLARLPGRVEQIKTAWDTLCFVDWQAEHLQRIHRSIKGLVDGARVLKIDRIAQSGPALMEMLAPLIEYDRVADASERQQINRLIREILESLRGNQAGHAISHPVEYNGLLYVVDEDVLAATKLTVVLEQAGYRCRIFFGPEEIPAELEKETPRAIIMEVVFGSEHTAGIDALARWRKAAKRYLPVLFLTARSDSTARLAALRAGGDAYLTKPCDFDDLLSAIRYRAPDPDQRPIRVMLVDDDEILGQIFTEFLDLNNIESRTLPHAEMALHALAEYRPDVLVLDMHMPGISGMELAAMIRQDIRFINLPIIFQTADHRPELRLEALGIGASVFLMKPVEPEELVATVRSQARLAANLRHRMHGLSRFNPINGLASNEHFLAELRHTIAQRAATPDSDDSWLLVVAIDRLEQLQNEISPILLGRFISFVEESLRRHLPLALPLDEERYAALLEGCDEKAAERNIQDLHQLVRYWSREQELPLTLSLGLYHITPQTLSSDAAMSAATDALYNAQRQGGNRLERYTPPESSLQHPGAANWPEEIDNLLANNGLRLSYQPVIAPQGSHEPRHEVLLRTTDPKAPYSPAALFAAAIRHDRAGDLDRHVISLAIRALAETPEHHLPPQLIVRLSHQTQLDAEFVPWLKQQLSALPVAQRRIHFLSTYLRTPEDLFANSHLFTALRNCGSCLIANLAKGDWSKAPDYKSNGVEKIKVQLTEFPGFPRDTGTLEQMKRLIGTAQESGAEVIIGGLEDPSALALLWDWGVRYFQGYFIREPTDALDYRFDVEEQVVEDRVSRF